MRVAILLLWIAIVIIALLPLLRRRARPVPLTSDELVKDPVCGTYVVRSRAVSRDGARFFCSPECAGRYGG
jgi:hypothetical protein